MRNKQQGFSLIEISVCLVLIAGCALGSLHLQQFTSERMQHLNRQDEALLIAERTLALLRTRGAVAELSDASVIHYTRDIKTQTLIQRSDSSPYSVNMKVLDTRLNGALKIVRIDVLWRDSKGNNQQLSLTTSISKFSEFAS